MCRSLHNSAKLTSYSRFQILVTPLMLGSSAALLADPLRCSRLSRWGFADRPVFLSPAGFFSSAYSLLRVVDLQVPEASLYRDLPFSRLLFFFFPALFELVVRWFCLFSMSIFSRRSGWRPRQWRSRVPRRAPRPLGPRNLGLWSQSQPRRTVRPTSALGTQRLVQICERSHQASKGKKSFLGHSPQSSQSPGLL